MLAEIVVQDAQSNDESERTIEVQELPKKSPEPEIVSWKKHDICRDDIAYLRQAD